MTDQQVSGRDVITWLGLAIVGAAAAVMSFTALADLARLMGVTSAVELPGFTFRVAWLLPIVVDTLAAVSTRVWLRRLGGPDAVRFAQRAAWGAIAMTVGGNAYHGYLTGHGAVDVVVVAAVPAVVFGTIVHLGMLIEPPAGGASKRTDSPTVFAHLFDHLAAQEWVAESLNREPGDVDLSTDARTAWMPDRRGDSACPPELPPAPSRDEPDEVLVADLRGVDAIHRKSGRPPLSNDGIRSRYGVGWSRAGRLRKEADKPPAGGRPHLVPTQDEEEVPA